MTCVTSLLRHAGRLAGAATGNDAEPPANGRALGRGEFTHRTGRDSGSMAPSDVVKWNKRVSLLYAIGAWTMFGSCGYYWYARRSEPRGKGLRRRRLDRRQEARFNAAQCAYYKTRRLHCRPRGSSSWTIESGSVILHYDAPECARHTGTSRGGGQRTGPKCKDI
ncbi:uncharacterized protein LOC114786774 isoform X1 [Denticeps clupeoides]|uniref:uncharacterized protein LOC114786774 isoform X1 n=1 Tax=Denticeps clupeoides TaxID=299321 RepID=UPI0010A500DF|nr:small integral membrane protein 26 isoform X1 [Denticeps clupeoides]